MGFIDAIKRWRLAKQGLSSGKKRRVHGVSPVVELVEDSMWVKMLLFAAFIVGSAWLVRHFGDSASFQGDLGKGMLYAVILSVAAVVMYLIGLKDGGQRNSRVLLVLGTMVGQIALAGVALSFARSGVICERHVLLIMPFALAPMLHAVLLGRTVGAYSAVFASLLGSLLMPRHLAPMFLIYSMTAGVTSVLLANKVRRRVQLLRAGIMVGLVIFVVSLLLGNLDMRSCIGPNAVKGLKDIGLGALISLGVAMSTAMLISGLLPFFEGAFQLTTDISWLELSDLNHKLLRRMQLEAPGTFHHSLVVAALAEAAAEKIGANAPMCRVCAYFHDVGKLKKPGYFIENQHDGGENPHDNLTPTMSALIIISHVKDGIDMAVKHKLNPRVIDIIQEHHGDSLVQYFYHKAREQKRSDLDKVDRGLENPEDLPTVDEKNFRYPGPRPRTRESSIISLADTVESASRSLRKPTPARIRALIEDLVRAKLNDGQLDGSHLTLHELAVVKESFASTLRSMLHSRIDYPKDDERKTSVPGSKSKPASAVGSEDSRVVSMQRGS